MIYSEPGEAVETAEPQSRDEELLKEIRDRYRAWMDQWRDARDERAIDMRFISGDPWEPEDRKARKDQGRPCINHDELTQYVNGAIGNMRAAKRGIACAPAGNGSDDKTAELAQNLIRSIEYKSQAQGAYLTAYQAMLEGGYGFIRLIHEYVSQDVDGPDDQEIRIANIPNPDSVLYDPSCKKADWSDARAVFVLDPLPKEEFKRQFPDARVVDFTEEDRRVAKDWIGEETVLVAEYWRVEISRRWNTRRTRQVEQRKIVQYLTNGVEILERNEQPGECPPIIPFIGIERWLDKGMGPVRQISSMVRLARDPQMSLAYLCSQQMEEAGLSPKAPYIGYVGQFETDKEAWDLLTKIPRAYVQADPIPDTANGQILPLPMRNQFTPNTAAYEVGKDSCRRAVQSAMGISPLPTAAQRDNQKSGVALERIHQQAAIGTLTFVDKFEAALAYTGRIIDSWIPAIYDAEDREVGIRLPDETAKVVRLNTRQPYLDQKTQQEEQHRIGPGRHEITISAGPSNDSTRQAASDFLDVLISNLGNLPVAPPQAAKLLSLAIQQKQLGPKGDEMAEIISPTDQDQPQIPPQVQAAMAQAQQQMQALDAYGKQQAEEVQKLQQKLDAHVIDNEYKLKIEQMKIEADITKAEITTKAQNLAEREAFVRDMWAQMEQHEADLQTQRLQHQQNQQAQEMQLQHEQMTQAADQQHAMELQSQAAQQAQAQAMQDQQALAEE
jgi:hypothetical protein